MHRLAAGLTFLSLFVPKVSAVFFGPPTQSVAIAFTGLWIPFTLVQLISAVTYLCLARPGHKLFAPVAIVGLLFLLISYVLRLFFLVATSNSATFEISLDDALNADAGQGVVTRWADALIILMIALIIRDRYITFREQRPNEKSALSTIHVWIMLGFITGMAFLLMLLAAAAVGISQSGDDQDVRETNGDLLRALGSVYLIATTLLIPFSVIVKVFVKTDTILNVTVFGVVPLCMLRAIALTALLPFNDIRLLDHGFLEPIDVLRDQVDNGPVIAANAVVDGVFYATALSILAYFFIAARRWGSQQGNSFQNQPEQFPGQWGYAGQPQQPQMLITPGVPQTQYLMVSQQAVPPQTGPIEIHAGQTGPQAAPPPSQIEGAVPSAPEPQPHV